MATIRYRQHRAVRAELRAAIQSYEQRAGLGRQLITDFKGVIDRIKSIPRACPRVPQTKVGEIRRALLHQFPYYVPYLIHDNEIVVLALAHH